MSWAFPFTATVSLVSQAEEDGAFGNPSESAPVTVRCDLQPKGSEAMYQEFGVETKFGAAFYVPVTEYGNLAVGAVVTHDGKRWRVAGEAGKRQYGSALDHASCPLERLDLETSE